MTIIEPHFYRNPAEVLGLSLDEGETLILPTGKVIPVRHDIWEYDSDALEEELSSVQEGFLARHRQKPPMTEIEELAWKLHKGERSIQGTFKPKSMDIPRMEVRESALAVTSDPLD